MDAQELLPLIETIQQLLEDMKRGGVLDPTKISDLEKNLKLYEKTLTDLDRSTNRLSSSMKKAQDSFTDETTVRSNANRALNRSSQALERNLKIAASNVVEFAKSSVTVQSSLTTLNPAIRASAQAASGLANTVAIATGGLAIFAAGFGPKGWIVSGIFSGVSAIARASGVAAEKIGEAAEWYVTTTQEYVTAFNAMAASGYGATIGLTGVAAEANRAGLQMGELSKIVGRSSANYALLFGSVAQGTRIFTEMSQSVRDGDLLDLRKLGYDPSEIMDLMSTYAALQARLGRRELLTADELAKRTGQYLKELSALSDLTGKSREDLMKERLEASRTLRFGQSLAHFEQMGRGDVAETASKLRESLGAISPELQKAVMDLIAGSVTEASQAGILATGGAAANVRAMLLAGKSETEILETLLSGARQADRSIGGRAAGILAEQGHDLFDQIQRILFAVHTAGQVDRSGRAARDSIEGIVTDTESANHQLAQTMNDVQKLTMEVNNAYIESLENITPVFSRFSTALKDTVTSMVGLIREHFPDLDNSRPPPLSASAQAVADRTVQHQAELDALSTPRPPRAGPSAPPSASHSGTISRGSEGTTQQQLISALENTGITDVLHQSNILAQIKAESNFKPQSENLNYSGQTLMRLFGPGNAAGNRVRVSSLQEANQIAAMGPEAVGNLIYGGRRDLGNAPNEGYLYRGRGLIQLTGKNNYRHYGDLLGIDLVNEPDLANDPGVAARIAAAYMAEKARSGVDLSDIDKVSRAVGHGTGAQGNALRRRYAAEIYGQLSQGGFRNGGISLGPESGYMQLLHGAEAVVPLPDGKSIPVDMAGPKNVYNSLGTVTNPMVIASPETKEMSTGFRELGVKVQHQLDAMTAQLSKMDEMIYQMQSSNSLNEKILQATRN